MYLLIYCFIHLFIYERVILLSKVFSAQVRHESSARHVSSDVISIMAEQNFPRHSPQCWLQHLNPKHNKV